MYDYLIQFGVENNWESNYRITVTEQLVLPNNQYVVPFGSVGCGEYLGVFFFQYNPVTEQVISKNQYMMDHLVQYGVEKNWEYYF